jgi:sugar/nucleoside kinase (ribokinase family)
MPYDFAVSSVLSIDEIIQADGSHSITPGSCGFYLALALGRLGVKVLYVGACGDDFDLGLLDPLHEAGISVMPCRLPGKNAHLKLVADQHGDIIFAHYDEGIGTTFRAEHLPETFWQAHMRWLGTVPFPLIDGAIQRGGGFCLSMQGELKGQADKLRHWIPAVGYLFANSREVSHYGFGDLETGITALLAANPALNLVITRSERGAWLITHADWYSVPAIPVQTIVDATGAGDAFSAACACRLWMGDSPEDALRWGAMAGALTLGGRAYTSLPNFQQLETTLKNPDSEIPVQRAARDSDLAHHWLAIELEHLAS